MPLRWPFVVVAGVAAGVHVWKVPPFLTQISSELGIGLVDAGILLGTVQIAGVLGGLAVGLVAELVGYRRCALGGLAVLAAASALGAIVDTFGGLLALRAVESLGFLLVVIAGPGLIRRVTPPSGLGVATGVWVSFQGISAFSTLGAAAALSGVVTYRGAWVAAAVVTALAAAALALAIPADPPSNAVGLRGVGAAVRRTASVPGLWIGGVVFLSYAASWMAVVGFLPIIFETAGLEPALASFMGGVASGINIVGAIVGGYLLQRGVPVRLLVWTGMFTMGLASIVVFLPGQGSWTQFAAICVYSAVGGLVPATLMRLALALTPETGSTPAAIGLTMQCSNAGMFIGPPVAAALTTATGTWDTTWWFTLACALVGAVLAALLGPRGFGASVRA